MLYKALEIKDLIEKKDSERQIIDLMENNNSKLKLVYLKKNERLDAHESHTDACINVLDGEIEYILEHDAACTCNICGCAIIDEEDNNTKKFKIKQNQLFMFEKGVMHSIRALKDSYFLVIKI